MLCSNLTAGNKAWAAEEHGPDERGEGMELRGQHFLLLTFISISPYHNKYKIHHDFKTVAKGK